MATHSSVLARRIPGKGEPGGLPSMGSHRGGHDWSDLAAAAKQRMGFPCSSAGKESACNARDLGLIPGWEDPLEKGKATPPVFWPGEFHGLYSPWGLKESDMTEWLSLHLKQRLWGKGLCQEGPMDPALLQYPFSLRYSSILRKTGVGQQKGIIFG